MVRLLLRDATTALICTALIFTSLQIGAAQVRSSTNFQIQSDSINSGGGLSESSSFSLESTIGESATGPSDSANFSLRAGYQQMQEVFLSITAAADVTLAPALGGLTGGTSNGSTSVVVTTDSPSGYSLSIVAESAPAMNSDTESIPDYDTTLPADFAFTVSSGAAFGFTPEGPDVVPAFLDNGSTCGVGSSDTSLACWSGLQTSDTVIAEATGANHPAGATTTVHFRVGVAANAGIPSGLYTATSTMTALPL